MIVSLCPMSTRKGERQMNSRQIEVQGKYAKLAPSARDVMFLSHASRHRSHATRSVSGIEHQDRHEIDQLDTTC